MTVILLIVRCDHDVQSMNNSPSEPPLMDKIAVYRYYSDDSIDVRKRSSMSCSRIPSSTSQCLLVVFYNNSRVFDTEDGGAEFLVTDDGNNYFLT